VRGIRFFALAASAAILAAACGGAAAPSPSPAASAGAAATAVSDYPTKAIDVMAPAGAGGGFDTTARLIQKALTDEKIVTQNITVSNVPGAGGTVGMAQLLKKVADPYALIVVGRVTIGSQVTGKTEAKVAQLTPIARMMAESEVIVTPKDSPYKTIKDVLDAIKKDVNSVKFAGGSAGGIDHELAATLVKAAGGDVKAWKSYVPFAGGGEAAAAIIGGQVQIGISGYGEFKGQIDSGTMKALAVSAESPLKAAASIPTLKSQGVDVVIVNWRMLAAPPGIPAGDLAALKAIAKKVHDSKTWSDFATKNDWFDNFTTEGLVTFIATEAQSVTATLTDLGLVK
jgi:putative tricarboxylic transport membrane protein